MDTLEELLKGVTTLPTPPAIALKIIEEVKKDKFSINDFARIISNDPSLTAKILSVANSSFYGLTSKVESIERAVSILGLEALKNIALSFVLVKGFKKDTTDGFDHDLFWRRSITAATCTEIMSARLNIKREDTFVTPLLMDVGVLVMYLCRPEDFLKVLVEKKTSRITMYEAEMDVFGFDHQAVGSAILKKWGLPADIYEPIAHHHNLNGTPPEIQDFVDVLMISDMVSSVYHSDRSTETYAELSGLLLAKFNLDDTEANELIDKVAEKTAEILESFDIDTGNIRPYSEILQEANEELGRLNLSYEQLVMELRQEKKKVESLAHDLKLANEKLRNLVFQDELTGLSNYRCFDDYLDKELSRAERYTSKLSIIVADIDHLKKINDDYGHTQGDLVLRSIAAMFEGRMRRPDTVARYSNGKFAFILPETDIKGAAIFGERLRKLVEEKEIKMDKETVKVTVSLGITTYNPMDGKKTKDEIMDGAERALYNSKKSGRNKLSIIT
jgi:diguanylate cyclase (GGDEF)-like protein